MPIQWQRKARALSTASAFVAVSANTAQDLRAHLPKRFGAPSPPRVVVGYNRISAERVVREGQPGVLQRAIGW